MSPTSFFRSLPRGAEWTGTKCGHKGQKGYEFYTYQHAYCRHCYCAILKERTRARLEEARRFQTSPAALRTNKIHINFTGKTKVLARLKAECEAKGLTLQAEIIRCLKREYGLK